jgi:hypothetical protein
MHDGMMILVYVDNCVIVEKDIGNIDQFILSLQNSPENFFLTNQGSIDKFPGIQIKRLGAHEFKISQPFLIDQIVTFLGLKSEEYEIHCNDKHTPAVAQILNKDLNRKPRKKSWEYLTVVGMMSYLQGHTRLDISMPVHQTAHFLNDPELVHEQAIT